MRDACDLVSVALVATRPIVVFSPGRGGCAPAPDRRIFRASAKVLSVLRTPATIFPDAGSMMSPTAFTATIAATTSPLGSVMDAVPIPDLVERLAPPNLPTVAPAPAPTEPSCTAPVVAASAAL